MPTLDRGFAVALEAKRAWGALRVGDGSMLTATAWSDVRTRLLPNGHYAS
jgi:hypothetical protein